MKVSTFIAIMTAIIVYISVYKYLTDKGVFEYTQVEENSPIYYPNTIFIINYLRVILSNFQLRKLIFIENMDNYI